MTGSQLPRGDILIARVEHDSGDFCQALTKLLPQLSNTAAPLTPTAFAAIVAAPDTYLYIARTNTGAVVGMLTLVMYRIPTGLRARIEDVIVDQDYRGLGIAEALTTTALHQAGHSGARTVDLTSSPSRESARLLYERLGFTARDTTTYRHSPNH
ncbi:GNAT family N-acetyltransferase [Nocardia sp. NPDC050435]|uniref:GNAT family N-acetyltransferase n=1 Tax=Nocardia sp. NPDC050435 TaxID=3155040 RepID=UPI00340AFF1A